ncbi:MAG: hypothetical protein RR595_08625 [Lysinibacillus sp.]
MAEQTSNYNLVKSDVNEFYNRTIDNENLEKIDTAIKEAKDAASDVDLSQIEQSIEDIKSEVTAHLDDYEYQVPEIAGSQIRLQKRSNTKRLLFKLENDLTGAITISLDNVETSKNLVDVDGVQLNSLDKGFHEIVQAANFFILRNKGGLSSTDLAALIAITNEAEANESVLRTQYVNSVNSADKTINLPAGATWNDILLKIPNINSEKKDLYTGTCVVRHTAVDGRFLEINRLPFKPSYVFLCTIFDFGLNTVNKVPTSAFLGILDVDNSYFIWGQAKNNFDSTNYGQITTLNLVWNPITGDLYSTNSLSTQQTFFYIAIE